MNFLSGMFAMMPMPPHRPWCKEPMSSVTAIMCLAVGGSLIVCIFWGAWKWWHFHKKDGRTVFASISSGLNGEHLAWAGATGSHPSLLLFIDFIAMGACLILPMTMVISGVAFYVCDFDTWRLNEKLIKCALCVIVVLMVLHTSLKSWARSKFRNRRS